MDLIGSLLETEPAKQTKQKIYTTGFGSREVTDLPKLLESLNAILIDIRFIPEVKPIQWSKEYLKLLLKNKYLHVPSLGDRKSKEGRMVIQNLSLGIKIITELKANLLLVCRCERKENCHRGKIIEELKEQGIDAEEIRGWKR